MLRVSLGWVSCFARSQRAVLELRGVVASDQIGSRTAPVGRVSLCGRDGFAFDAAHHDAITNIFTEALAHDIYA